jgi:hypothetical protein
MQSPRTVRLLPALALILALAPVAAAQQVPEFNPATGELTIPQVKAGAQTIYNAKLKFEGSNNFKLLSYQTAAPVPDPVPVTAIPALSDAAALQQWLDQGTYKSWACEPTKHGPTLGSAHGSVRICSNPLMAASSSGSYPVGAASVKELYSGDAINGYAIGVKVAAGEGANTWHWYERIGSVVVANSVGAGICEGCHRNASRDRIYVRVAQ